MNRNLLSAGLCLPAVLSAQQATMSWSLAAPIVASTLVAGSTDMQTSNTLPGVVLSTQSAGPESAAARITTVTSSLAAGLSFAIEHRLDVATGGPSSSSAATSADVLLQFTALSPESVAIQLSSSLLATAGVPAAQFAVDLDDDGSIEFVGGPQNPAPTFARQLGPVPLLVRVRVDAALAITGSLSAGVQVVVVPTHATQIDVVLFGCSVPHHLYAARTFGGGVELGLFGAPAQGPVLLLFGLGVLPFVLPSSAPTPCVLLPTIDIVALIPSPNGYALPLPPSVRPVTFWTQAVPVLPSGFEATGAYRIQAN